MIDDYWRKPYKHYSVGVFTYEDCKCEPEAEIILEIAINPQFFHTAAGPKLNWSQMVTACGTFLKSFLQQQGRPVPEKWRWMKMKIVAMNMDNDILEYMIQNNIFNLLDQIEEDPVLFWVYAENYQWYLCCQCEVCDEWMEFTDVAHTCRGIIPLTTPAIELRVLQYTETCTEELTAGVLCEETLFEDLPRTE